MISALRGYQWRWRALNIQAGIGLNYFSSDKDFVLKSSSGDKMTVSNPLASGIGLGYKLTVGRSF